MDPISGIIIDTPEYDIPGLPAGVVWDVLEMCNDVTRKVAKESDIPLIGAAQEMLKDSDLYSDWIHYLNLGAKQMRVIVSRKLEKIVRGR